jgi:predicted nucleic acid-binding protein
MRALLQQSVRALEARFASRILPVSNSIVLRWGTISGEVKRLTGHPPAVIDTLLAATAIEHGLYFATRNTAHVLHSGAAIFNPWKDNAALFPL